MWWKSNLKLTTTTATTGVLLGDTTNFPRAHGNPSHAAVKSPNRMSMEMVSVSHTKLGFSFALVCPSPTVKQLFVTIMSRVELIWIMVST